MTRGYTFVACDTFLDVPTKNDGVLKIPVVQGILKHPDKESLPLLLQNEEILTKYTCEAIKKASWQILSKFPRKWLKRHLSTSHLSEGRQKALTFLLTD